MAPENAPGANGISKWDEQDIASLLTLDEVAPGQYRSRMSDANLNGRSFGGQLLGQAMMAACRAAPPGRSATAMQMLFLQGADPLLPIDFKVSCIQDGKRFASRHVTANQAGGRQILDAQLTFAVPLDAPAHQATLASCEEPELLPGLSSLPTAWADQLTLLGGYATRARLGIDFRLPQLQDQLSPEGAKPKLRFWLKARQALPDDPAIHAAAFAYLSDWWINFAALLAHMHSLVPQRSLYTSSLNHSIWLHRQPRADAWMHCDCESPAAADGRGLTVARIHDQAGVLIASATQECLMSYTDGGPRLA